MLLRVYFINFFYFVIETNDVPTPNNIKLFNYRRLHRHWFLLNRFNSPFNECLSDKSDAIITGQTLIKSNLRLSEKFFFFAIIFSYPEHFRMVRKRDM